VAGMCTLVMIVTRSRVVIDCCKMFRGGRLSMRGRMAYLRLIGSSPKNSLVPLVTVLDRLHAEEETGTSQRRCQEPHKGPPLTKLSGTDGPGHGQAAEDQYDGIQ